MCMAGQHTESRVHTGPPSPRHHAPTRADVHTLYEAQGAGAQAYGAQAVVVSIDPRRVWAADPADTPRPTVATANFGPHGEAYCWWQARDWAPIYSP